MEVILVLQNVAVVQHHVGPGTERLLGELVKRGVDLHAQDRAGAVREPGRHAAGAGAHFQHEIRPRQLSMPDDEIDEIEIDEEILPQLVLGCQTVRLE